MRVHAEEYLCPECGTYAERHCAGSQCLWRVCEAHNSRKLLYNAFNVIQRAWERKKKMMPTFRCPVCHHILSEGEVVGWLCLTCGQNLPDDLEAEDDGA